MLKEILKKEKPLQIVGVMNAYIARMAEKVGFRAIYLSGANVANSSFGIPDIGKTTLENVFEEAKRIKGASSLPLLVDLDTGFGNISNAIQKMIEAGAAGIHIEDQVADKKCGHLPGKNLVSIEEMVERIKEAKQLKGNHPLILMARTDALQEEGVESTLKRAKAYVRAGADALFLEAVTDLNEYHVFKEALDIPILLNLTEFGQTPLFTLKELKDVDMVLYPLSANRAMNKAAEKTLKEIREKGSQKALIQEMQTRQELYHYLRYKPYE